MVSNQGLIKIFLTMRRYYHRHYEGKLQKFDKSCYIYQKTKTKQIGNRPCHAGKPLKFKALQTLSADVRRMPRFFEGFMHLRILVCDLTYFVIDGSTTTCLS